MVSAERLEGTQVFVCEDETETACKTCGTVDATGPGQWAVVVCLANAEGSLVKIIAPNTHLQICEVEVVGADRKSKLLNYIFHFELCISFSSWPPVEIVTDYPTLPPPVVCGGVPVRIKTSESFRWNFLCDYIAVSTLFSL